MVDFKPGRTDHGRSFCLWSQSVSLARILDGEKGTKKTTIFPGLGLMTKLQQEI